MVARAYCCARRQRCRRSNSKLSLTRQRAACINGRDTLLPVLQSSTVRGSGASLVSPPCYRGETRSQERLPSRSRYGHSGVGKGIADGEKNASLFARHLHHHVFMNQKHRVVLGLRTYGTYVPLGFALVMAFSKMNILSGSCGLLVHAGWLGGSLLYDGMHYSFHHGPDLKFDWYAKMKAQHMRHHFRDNSVEFGVTNPWWDIVFGTSGAKHTPLKAA